MKVTKKSTAALCGLLAVALVGSSFAYWNQTSTIENPFDTSKYGTTVVEDFKPEEGQDWQPGVKVDKIVNAKNTGDTDVIVRIRLDETWTYKPTADSHAGVTYKDSTGTAAGTTAYNLYNVSQADPLDGLTALDESVVAKGLSSFVGTGATATWIPGADGWYYYKTNLPGGEDTENFLESVTLDPQADMGKFETTYEVAIVATPTDTDWINYDAYKQANGIVPAWYNTSTQAFSNDHNMDQVSSDWVPVLHNRADTHYVKDANGDFLLGYSQSDYVLKVTVQSVQATQEAIDAVFNGGAAFTAPTGTAWTLR